MKITSHYVTLVRVHFARFLSIAMFNCTIYKMIGNVLECLAVFGNYLRLISTSTAPIQDVLDYKYTHICIITLLKQLGPHSSSKPLYSKHCRVTTAVYREVA